MNTKYADWSYEDEYRMTFTPDEFYEEGDLDFVNFNSQIKLSGLVLGPLNDSLDKSSIESLLPLGSSIKVIKARTAFQSFRIVRRKDIPTYVASGSEIKNS